jgi:hypothetical protein
VKARSVLAALGAVVILAAAACDDNPLSEGRDETARFRLNPSFANVAVGDSTFVTAIAVNEYNEPTGESVQASACDGKISVANDPRRSEYEPPERFVIKGVTAGESCVNVTGGGQSASVTITVVDPD